jgi:hypothetical protein
LEEVVVVEERGGGGKRRRRIEEGMEEGGGPIMGGEREGGDTEKIEGEGMHLSRRAWTPREPCPPPPSTYTL